MENQRKDDLKYGVDIDTTPPNITINPHLGSRAPQETKDWESRGFRFLYKIFDYPCRFAHGKFGYQVDRIKLSVPSSNLTGHWLDC